ncbi:hypothetical protein H7849_19710 [Alloacidobacterium dinghuense]|uniref:TIR domain-containing protein n=1 Tax=Alloacidobacterium dinghuense TaxID=2763107 RepID=A0A7G8BFH6_9BACT|nr:hypothetical protein [Alloacidobacterium dinghuense]QNI31296.1 hypothetical protein H7849_19710 [Alloacidobacterium dinghuense]
MALDNPEYDVAISFLAKDEAIAEAFYRGLSETLGVFYYPKNQEDLAGTDGMETMRKPFLEDSRVMVVLYREQWGKTRWTAIEETAIKEACFNGGWKRLFFVALEKTGLLPNWLPEYYVRYNFEEFGIDQAIGIIKSRVLENGGQLSPMTPLKKAELLRIDEQYRYDKSRMDSPEGLAQILEKVKELFKEIYAGCEELNTQGHQQIVCESNYQNRATDQAIFLINEQVSITVVWHQLYFGRLENSGLYLREFNGRILLPSELGHFMQLRPPDQIREIEYEPELSRSREYGWTLKRKSQGFISSKELATKCILQFMELMEKMANGKIRRPKMY